MTLPLLPQGWIEYVFLGTLVVVVAAFLGWVLSIVLLWLDSLILHVIHIGGIFS